MKIEIKGPIINDGDQWIYDWFGRPATSPSKVSNIIENAKRNNVKELTVVINSNGGYVFSASEIYTELKKFSGNVKVEIVGMAASAASVIAMAGTYIEMSPTAQLMIHNATMGAQGDYRDMDHTSDFLKKVNQSIMTAYTAKTGKTVDELKAMMDVETFMTAQEAKEAGFIDAVMFENEIAAVANAGQTESVSGLLPQEVLDKMREQLANDNSIAAVNSTTTPIKNEKGEGKQMDIETLKNEHPELVNQLVEEAVTNAVTAERQRIQDIENIAVPGSEEIVNKAKFETGVSAADTAMEILKNGKTKRATGLQNLQQDADPLNNVEPGALPQNTESKEQKVNNLVENTLKNLGMWGGK